MFLAIMRQAVCPFFAISHHLSIDYCTAPLAEYLNAFFLP